MFKNVFLFLCILVLRNSIISKYIRFFLDIVVAAFRSERCCTMYLIRSISIITGREWFIVLSWRCLIRRDRNLDRGYSRSLPTPTFRHSRTRHKSRSWVIARRVGRYVCAHKRSRCTRLHQVHPCYYFTFRSGVLIIPVSTSNRVNVYCPIWCPYVSLDRRFLLM